MILKISTLNWSKFITNIITYYFAGHKYKFGTLKDIEYQLCDSMKQSRKELCLKHDWINKCPGYDLVVGRVTIWFRRPEFDSSYHKTFSWESANLIKLFGAAHSEKGMKIEEEVTLPEAIVSLKRHGQQKNNRIN